MAKTAECSRAGAFAPGFFLRCVSARACRVAPGMAERDENPQQDARQRESPNDRDEEGHVRMPPDTGPNPPAMPGTSEHAKPVQGIYRPDVGPGGADIDTGDRSLAGRSRAARGPHHGERSAPEPEEEHRED